MVSMYQIQSHQEHAQDKSEDNYGKPEAFGMLLTVCNCLSPVSLSFGAHFKIYLNTRHTFPLIFFITADRRMRYWLIIMRKYAV